MAREGQGRIFVSPVMFPGTPLCWDRADVHQPEQEQGEFIILSELFQVLPILKKEFIWNKCE